MKWTGIHEAHQCQTIDVRHIERRRARNHSKHLAWLSLVIGRLRRDLGTSGLGPVAEKPLKNVSGSQSSEDLSLSHALGLVVS